MNAKKLAAVVFSFVLLAIPLAGCELDDPVRPEDAAFDADRLLTVLDRLTEDHVVSALVTDDPELAPISLGGDYRARAWRPAFAESWALVAAMDDEPDYAGSGLSFAKCVKKRLDKGEKCTLEKVGDEYHAHCEDDDPS